MLKLVKANAKMGIGECREIVKDYEREAKASQRRAGGKPHFTWLTDRFDDIVERAAALLVADNARDPHLFRMSSAVVRLGEDEATNAILTEPVGKQILRQELNRLATWGRMDAENEKSISCPGDIAEHLINDPELGLPPLTSIVDAPFFDREGRLILEAGYHAPSFTYHHPRSGLAFDPVSPAPSAAEIERARELLLVDVDGDFPFSDGTPGSRSSRAHAVALKLEMFVRQMIQGQTPIYLIQKPSPGTGATLFVNAAAEIGFGSPAVPQAEVHSPEEFRKNLTATLMTGTSLYWLDNVHKRIDSSSLALATTTEVWRDRILGVSKTVVLPVRCSWIISGNNVELSEELARRAVLIRFDANLERPTERQGFRHPDLIGHIRRNRGALVWACLTLVQAWIAAGRPAGEARLASYEAWSRVMSGILAIAGMDGLLENRDELKEATADDDAPMKAFVRLWHGEFGHARVPTSAPESDGGSGLTSLRSLLDLYQVHAHEIDLGFNSIRREAWPSLLGRTINKYRNRVFEIAETSGAIIRVKLRAERTSGGAVKWLERISP